MKINKGKIKEELCELYAQALDDFVELFKAHKEALKNQRTQKNGEESEDSSPEFDTEPNDD